MTGDRTGRRRRAERVAIVGGGAAGALTAVHLLREDGGFADLEVLIIDRTREFGPGVAYGTEDDLHLLNVPTVRMGGISGRPEHFHEWLREHGARRGSRGPRRATRDGDPRRLRRGRTPSCRRACGRRRGRAGRPADARRLSGDRARRGWHDRHGTAANAISSVSLDPPLLLACLARNSETPAAIRQTGRFAINILADDQRHHSDRFGKKGPRSAPTRLSSTIIT
jgi:glycine/D-amino acid oxidase-like deaminating enzyme